MRTLRRAGIPALMIAAMGLTACGSSSDSTAGSTAAGGDSASAACGSGTLNAEGSSAQKNAIEQVIADYQASCAGLTVNYNPTGSGAGIKQFIARQADFAGSDSALNAAKGEVADAQKRCSGNPAWDIPMVTGPIAAAYQLDGVTDLTLTPALLGEIFAGKIKTWNDAAIAKVNAGVTLPNKPIKVFFRSDESGTTENFTKYLKAASGGTWSAAAGKAWPSSGTGEGREKSAGVAEGVKATDGGITYVEWSYAKDNSLSVAKIDNGGGAVELTGESVAKAVAGAEQKGTGNDLALSLDYTTKEAGAYPILLVTYEIVCSKGLDAGKTQALKGFLKYFASAEAQTGLEEIGYAPLPEALRTKVATAIDAIS